MVSDISDLEGAIPSSLRWNAEEGSLAVWTSGECQEIVLGSREAAFAIDLATRMRGYGLIRTGAYDMILTPVGSDPPKKPSEDYKPAIGVWACNPIFGEVRIETVGAMFRTPLIGLFSQCQSTEEAGKDMVPIAMFAGSRERVIKSVGKTFLTPIIDIVHWLPRDITPFAIRERTVRRAPLLSSLDWNFVAPVRPLSKPKAKAKAEAVAQPIIIKDELDDEIPY
jgi:hypothetical protein